MFNLFSSSDMENFEYEPFVTKRISPKAMKLFSDTYEKEKTIISKIDIPKSVKIMRNIVYVLATLTTFVLIRLLIRSPQNYAIPLVICIAMWVCLFALNKYSKSHMEINAESNEDEIDKFLSAIENIDKEIEHELGIPQNIEDIEFLLEQYTVDKEGVKKHKDFPMYSHLNHLHSVFIENGCLCITSNVRIEIPLTSLTYIEDPNKRASFPDWNKEEPYTSEEYRKYKVTTNSFNTYFTNYYIVHIEGGYCLLIPNYDIEKFQKLTHLRIEDRHQDIKEV